MWWFIWYIKKNNLITKSGILNGNLLFGNDGKNHIISKEFNNIWKIPENFFSNFNGNEILNSINNIDLNFSLDKIDFGKYNDKKDDIINNLKSTMMRLETFDIKKEKEKIIETIKMKIKEWFTDLLIKAIQSTEFGQYVRNISDKYEEMMNNIL